SRARDAQPVRAFTTWRASRPAPAASASAAVIPHGRRRLFHLEGIQEPCGQGCVCRSRKVHVRCKVTTVDEALSGNACLVLYVYPGDLPGRMAVPFDVFHGLLLLTITFRLFYEINPLADKVRVVLR